MTNFQQVFEENNLEYIQFQFTNVLGHFKGVEFPVNIWDEMKEGTGIDGSSIGILGTEQSDMRIVPDFDTFAILPWNIKTGRFICDITDNEGNPHPCCARSLLKRVINEANRRGYEFQVRPELEWYFLKKNYEPADRASYMELLPRDVYSYLRGQIADDMVFMGIDLKTIHHENGPGQQEIEFAVNDALKQADNVQTGKLIVKTDAYFEDIIATFMPKPLPQRAGSGLHIHQYLTKNGENVFSDPEKGLSDTLRYYVGGIQKHIDPISAVLNPATNSYKRLVTNHEAPVYVAWGVGNRTALIRVPGYEKSARIEYRAGDAMMNVYLGTAVLLAAGLDGIKNGIEPTNPTDRNLYKVDEEKEKKLNLKLLPRRLKESLIAFEESNFMKNLLGNDLFNSYINSKHLEIEQNKQAKKDNGELDWEIEKYLHW